MFFNTRFVFVTFLGLSLSFYGSGQTLDYSQFKKTKNIRAKCRLAHLLSDDYFENQVDSIEVVLNELFNHQDDTTYGNLVKSTILYLDGRRIVRNRGNISLARKKVFMARNYFFAQQNLERVVQSNILIANSYYLEGKFQKAIQYYQKSLELAIDLENQAENMESLFGISRSYIELGDTIKGLNFLEEYLDVTIEDNFPRSHAKAIAYKAMIHFDSGDRESARRLYRKSAEVSLSSNLKEEYADGLTNQAIYFYLIDEMDSSITYFRNALFEREKLGAIKPIIEANFNLGSVYYGLENYKKALPYFLESKQIAHENGFWLDEKDANEELISFHKKHSLGENLWKKIQKDQIRLEKQVEHQSKINTNLDRQMEFWLKNGLKQKKENQSKIRNQLPNWLSTSVLLLIIIFGGIILKKQ